MLCTKEDLELNAALVAEGPIGHFIASLTGQGSHAMDDVTSHQPSSCQTNSNAHELEKSINENCNVLVILFVLRDCINRKE